MTGAGFGRRRRSRRRRSGRAVGPGRQEQLDELRVTALGGRVERRVAVVLRRVHVRAGGDQDAADLDVPPGRGAVERLVRESRLRE